MKDLVMFVDSVKRVPESLYVRLSRRILWGVVAILAVTAFIIFVFYPDQLIFPKL